MKRRCLCSRARGRTFLAALCWCVVVFAGIANAGSPDEDIDQTLIYQVTNRASLDPDSGLAHVSIEIKQPSQLVDKVLIRMPEDRFLNIRADSPVDIESDHVTWQPGELGSTLRYDVVIEHRRSNGALDAQITDRWALFKLDHLFPGARTHIHDGSSSETKLVLSAPEGWSIETPYGSGAGEVLDVDNPERGFDQPRGWAMAGRLSVRRDSVSGRSISVASPEGTGFRATDMLSFLNWTLPSLVEVFPQLNSRLLIVSGTQDMWRGGLSGRSSLYMHPDRPLVSGNRTSTLLHEMVHVASRMRSEDGADWIVEGIAEFYSVELLYRSGGISKHRYNSAFNMLSRWSKGIDCVSTDRSQGKRTAAAALVMRDLDEEIRSKTGNEASLDTLVNNLLEKSRIVSNASFRATAEELVGKPVAALADCP